VRNQWSRIVKALPGGKPLYMLKHHTDHSVIRLAYPARDESLRYRNTSELCLHRPLASICESHFIMPQLGSPVLVIFGRLADPSQVILGGGQDAMSVTTTSARSGKFESRFYHKLFEEEVGRVKGHL
jgi:hypothetical protein